MRPEIITAIIAGIIWSAVEGWLIYKDRGAGKGTTTQDNRTRLFNALAIEAALILTPLIALLPFFHFAGFQSPGVFWIGTAGMALGAALRYWAIAVLGRNFRTTIEVERGQKVVQAGPYRLIRHPSYSGILLFCLGYGLIAQNALALLVAVVAPTLALVNRIAIEEVILARGLGPEYQAYQKRTKKLVPYIW